MNKYEVIRTIGEGAYGVVLQCRNKETQELVAIKRFKESDEDELVRKTTLREVKILRLLKEETHVVHLLEAFRRKGKLYLVFEYVGCNLLDVLEAQPQGLDMEDVRRMIFTLLLGIRACHSNSVIHRDIKPENLLLHPDNTLRLCDFGFARIYNPSMNDLTDYVATRWYRSPELLLGTTDYGLASDMWAAGCIMAEMIDGQALFPGETELDQIFMIQKLLGNLTPQQADTFRKNKRFANETLRDIQRPDTTLERKYGRKANRKALSFLKSLLVIDPDRRLTVDEALNHPFFEGMMETYAPHLKLVTPLIRPGTANRYGNTPTAMAQSITTQPQEVPPRPASTTTDPQQGQNLYSGGGAYAVAQTPPVTSSAQQQQQQQQVSSRVSQASSTSTTQQIQPSRGSSFLPSRIGSGHRRPPSQQQQSQQDALPGSAEGSFNMATPQQQQQQLQQQQAQQRAQPHYSYGGQQYSQAPMYAYGGGSAAPSAYAVGGGGGRGNLPRLGPTPLAVAPAIPAGNYGRYGGTSVGSALVNGGHNPSSVNNNRQAPAPQDQSPQNGMYRPPPSQQSRSRFYYNN